MKEKQNSLTPKLWKLIILCSIASFCTLLPADAIKPLAQHFNISLDSAVKIINWCLIGYGIGPLLYAPLANRYGRKAALFAGMFIALVGNLLSISSIFINNYNLMLLGRLTTGIGVSSGFVIGILIINETASAIEARSIFSKVTLCFSFAPALAMSCGGYTAQHISTTALFYITLGLIIAAAITAYSIQETYTKKLKPICLKNIITRYAAQIKHKKFIYSSIIMSLGCAVMYVFNGISPLIATGKLNISASYYGNMEIIPSLGIFAGSIISTHCSKKHSSNRMIFIGLISIIISAASMFYFFVNNYINLISLIAPAFILFVGAALIIPNASMSAISNATDPAIGASIVSSGSLLLSGAAVSIASFSFKSGPDTLPVILTILPLCGIILLGLEKKIKHRNNNSNLNSIEMKSNA